jgi:hypothetical protein
MIGTADADGLNTPRRLDNLASGSCCLPDALDCSGARIPHHQEDNLGAGWKSLTVANRFNVLSGTEQTSRSGCILSHPHGLPKYVCTCQESRWYIYLTRYCPELRIMSGASYPTQETWLDIISMVRDSTHTP